jgi:subtilisin family serine protease
MAAGLSGLGRAAASPPGGKGSYIVVLEDRAEADRVIQRAGVAAGVEQRYSTVLNGFAAVLDDAARGRLEADPDVVSVSINRSYPATNAPATPAVEAAQEVPAAVARVGGLLSPTALINGVDERVDADIAIFDGGLPRGHPDLNVVGGVNCTKGKKSDWVDRDGHGTYVASIAAAIDNGIGTVGIAPGARLWAVRVVNTRGYATDAAEICGLEWIAKQRGAIDVVNVSLSGPKAKGHCPRPKQDAIHRAICKVVANGTVVVASAGNEASNAAGTHYASYSEVIAVSAFADSDGLPGGLGGPPRCEPYLADDTFADWSNYGRAIDITAPGSCVYGAFPDGYGYNSGTSASAPLVAGAAVLLKARNPGWSPADVRQALLAAATPGPIPGDPDRYPEPVLNVAGF